MRRRSFLKHGLAGALALPAIGHRLANGAGPNAEVRIGVIGLGGIKTVGGVGGRGRQIIARLAEVPGVRIAALCDVDRVILDHELQPFKQRGQTVAAHSDLRRVLDDRSIDAVAIATPNHWHALATVWACQAGKDVYVEKPFSYNIWEGRQMVAAARKYGRMVQVGTQRRSSVVLRQAVELVRSGLLGPIRAAHAMIYRAREGIGKMIGPSPVPATVDYDLWCGPAPRTPLARKQLHYDWHWIWATGNGEIGNNGAHMIDVCRWALGQNGPPPRAMSIGGRFAFNDDGQTPNVQVAVFDYQPAPLVCEIRNLRRSKAVGMGKFRGSDRPVIVECEGGYFAGDASGGAFFDNQGTKIKDLAGGGKPQEMETAHLTNFVAAMRSRKPGELAAEAQVGHVSAACCHMANVSHRLGTLTSPAAILEANRSNRVLADAFTRCRDYLKSNGIDLETKRAMAGPWVTLDPQQERFVGEFADAANQLARRPYREPFVVPTIA